MFILKSKIFFRIKMFLQSKKGGGVRAVGAECITW